MIGLSFVYLVAGLLFTAIAVASGGDATNPRRWRNAAFWGLIALSFVAGDRLGDLGNGVVALVLTALAAWGLGRGVVAPVETQGPTPSAFRLFAPALTVPFAALGGTLILKSVSWDGRPLIDPKQLTLVSLTLGVIAALALVQILLRPPLPAPVREGRRLFDQVGWAVVLPQALAALGAVFALGGVGEAVSGVVRALAPNAGPVASVIVYTAGMALFTMVMGNAFAAFPVMTAGVGLPLIVHRFGGDPAVMGALGMLSGFCGTLLTPMAANFNVVPVALLELSDRYAVIKAQAPTALILLIANTVLMVLFVYRR